MSPTLVPYMSFCIGVPKTAPKEANTGISGSILRTCYSIFPQKSFFFIFPQYASNRRVS